MFIPLLGYAIVYSFLVWFPFERLLVVDMWVTGAYSITTLALLARLRSRSCPERSGFRVPGGKMGAWIVLILPTATWIVALYATARQDWPAGTAALLSGSIIYAVLRFLRRDGPAAGARRAARAG